MPAIQLARLKLQAVRLGEKFSQPDAFIKDLYTILDFYADRTHRPGKSGEPAPLLQAHHVPAPVIRQIIIELAATTAAQPEQALLLCDALWKQPSLECRLIAAELIGCIPTNLSHPILHTLRLWLNEEYEDILIEAMLKKGMERLRKEKPNQYIGQVRVWLDSPILHEQQVGLRALRLLVEDDSFLNLPVLFRLLAPYVRVAPSRLRPHIARVLHLLARRSPQETAYFLRQNLQFSESTDTGWAIRQVLHSLPPGLQESLRAALREPGIKR